LSRAPVLFDTSVYIPFLRGEAYATLIEEAVRSRRVRLSSVVWAELYAGARSRADKRDLDLALAAHGALGLVVNPSVEDWSLAGQVLAGARRLYGAIEPRPHLNDVLILLGAGRVGARLVTENARDFGRWARLLRRMGTRVGVVLLERSAHLDA
jgi:predicted nucleic acid-binding protein